MVYSEKHCLSVLVDIIWDIKEKKILVILISSYA